MNRISTYIQTISAQAEIMRTQRALADTQRQASSGLKANDLQGYGLDAGRLMSLRTIAARNDAAVEQMRQLTVRVDSQALALERFQAAAEETKAAIADALSLNSGVELMNRLQNAFAQARDAINADVGGRYLFAGASSDSRPVTADTLDALAALPATDDAFDHADYAETVRLPDGSVIEAGPRARAFATGLFDLLRTIKQFSDGPGGPLTGQLTPAQRDFLTSQMTAANSVREAAGVVQGANGGVQRRVDDLAIFAGERRDLWTGLAGEVSDADMGEVATRLAALQTQFQASAQVFSQVSRLTLLDYLR
jgi:flagellar hook-associated protein 3 FlgL